MPDEMSGPLAKAVASASGGSPARRAHRQPSPGVVDSLGQLESVLGGRKSLLRALAQAPGSADLDYVLGLIGDPANATLALAEICAQGGVTPGELLEAYKAGEVLRGQVLAARAVGDALPTVVAHTLRKAAPHEDTCYGCSGLGETTPEPTKKEPNPSPLPCPACKGAGRLLYDGDLDYTKLALELGQLTSKGGGVNVQVDARQAHLHGGGKGSAAGGALEQLLAASDRILYGDGLTPSDPPASGGSVVASAASGGSVAAATVVEAELVEVAMIDPDLTGPEEDPSDDASPSAAADPGAAPPADSAPPA